MIKKINHIAIAVKNIEESARFYEQVLGLALSGTETVPEQKTKAGFLKIGETNIELVQPAGPDSPIAKFIETRGQGIHHICFEVDDLESEVKEYLKKGAVMVDQQPKRGAHGTKVAFIHPKSSGSVLIELCETP